MPFPGESWPLDFKAIACVFHSLAISSSIFRLTYRWYISRFGWEDSWAVLAFITDVGCLTCSWLQRSVPLNPSDIDTTLDWIAVTCLTSTPWVARLSMLSAIIRITNPSASVRRMSYIIAISFGSMWIAILVQKMYACGTRLCRMPHDVAISQSITDGIADVLLVFMPISFLKDVKISRTKRILLLSSFSSSICISIISIAQAVSFFLAMTTGLSLLLIHIKAALSVVICNLLIVVAFTYRFYHKMDMDLNGGFDKSDPIQLTTVIPGQMSLGSARVQHPCEAPALIVSQVPECRQTMY
ncbi:hypothetical protein L210DRAFT_985772 [Boletus edulis BED1]|uniref:Rhodopsin domain-containing protein n=1 Tax=Boletus edulis BED1 TaxID=1328754 RepID=A0AAD4GAW3_BOLED|nr:hypothetical protein L210DRAFT_985772 [Boletus edulis BED1]